VDECNREALIMRRIWPSRGCCPMERKKLENYISICSDSQAALKALQAVKTTYPLERQCHRALDKRSVHRSVRLIWLHRHSGVSGNKIIDERAREGSAHNEHDY
jgi:ribonuclease HI